MLEEHTPHQQPTAGGSGEEEGVDRTSTAEDAEGAQAQDGVSVTVPGMTAPPFIETGRRGAVGNLLHEICTSLCCVSPSSIMCHHVSHNATSAPAASRTGGKDHTRGCVGVSGLVQRLRFLPLQACMQCVHPALGIVRQSTEFKAEVGWLQKLTCVAEAVQKYDGSCAGPQQHLIWVPGVRGAMQSVIRALAAWHAHLCEWSMAVQLQSGQKRLPWSCCIEYLHVYISSWRSVSVRLE